MKDPVVSHANIAFPIGLSVYPRNQSHTRIFRATRMGQSSRHYGATVHQTQSLVRGWLGRSDPCRHSRTLHAGILGELVRQASILPFDNTVFVASPPVRSQGKKRFQGKKPQVAFPGAQSTSIESGQAGTPPAT